MKKELINLRHRRSLHDFPELKLEEGEYVELAIRRSKVGLILIWSGEILGFIILTLSLVLLSNNSAASGLLIDPSAKAFLNLIIFVLYGVLIITGLIGSKVYNSNRLFVTNKRLIQESTFSLFAKSTNIIDLISIEDVSFRKEGIFDYLFRIGTIRMSTFGDETTYTFKYIDTPTDELEIITHLVHIEKEKTKEINKHNSKN